MKKILKFSLVLVAVVLTAVEAHARNADFSLDLKKEEGKTVSFTLREVKKIDLSIYDKSDNLIYQEKVTSDDNINRTYDLTAFPEGVYFLEAESDLKISRYKIEVVGKVAKLSVDAISEVYKPVLVNKNGTVVFNMLNTSKVPVTVKIYNSNDTEVYNETLSGELNVKIFDISKIQDDRCTFVITSNGKTFIETVNAK
jgi:predicted transcriptional regulator